MGRSAKVYIEPDSDDDDLIDISRRIMAVRIDMKPGNLNHIELDVLPGKLEVRGEGDVRKHVMVTTEFLSRFADDSPCDFDHHGYCQGHNDFSGEGCRNAKLLAIIEEVERDWRDFIEVSALGDDHRRYHTAGDLGDEGSAGAEEPGDEHVGDDADGGEDDEGPPNPAVPAE
jgi:hypothetical protein